PRCVRRRDRAGSDGSSSPGRSPWPRPRGRSAPSCADRAAGRRTGPGGRWGGPSPKRERAHLLAWRLYSWGGAPASMTKLTADRARELARIPYLSRLSAAELEALAARSVVER